MAIRNFPGREMRVLLRKGVRLVGIMSMKPSGSSCSFPLERMKTLRFPSFVQRRRSPRPSSSQSFMVHGFSERKQSGPPSMMKPSIFSVTMHPPNRFSFSIRITSISSSDRATSS